MSSRSSLPAGRTEPLDGAAIRRDFPILQQRVHGKPLVYLDNAATTQKPQVVIDRLTQYYAEENANVHRGVHWLSDRATDAFEEARATVGRFLNARESREIVFVRGTTEAINLVAATYGRSHVGPGDEIVISAMEHHSNIVPWQILCEQRGRSASHHPDHRRGRTGPRRVCDAADRSDTNRVDRARVERAGHREPGRGDSFASRISAAFRCWWTARRPSRTGRSTYRRSGAISTRSPATRCSVRPASACSTGRRRCSSRCRRIRAAAT